MKNFLMNLIRFKMAQNTGRGMARMVGFGRLGMIIGLVSGVRALMNHRRNRHYA
ncbi:MAG TPA: hypothetical protein VGF48_00045 [Thermoanaerobaculia bacterium]|jgi:hypothetical protein